MNYKSYFVTIILGQHGEDFFTTRINAESVDEVIKFYEGYYYTYWDETTSPKAHFIEVEDDKGNVKTHTYSYEEGLVC